MNFKLLITAATLALALVTSASAKIELPSMKAHNLMKKMNYAASQAAKKETGEEAKINAFIKSLNSRLEEYKEAVMESCVASWGVEKAGACSCFSEQFNYQLEFRANAVYFVTDNNQKELEALAAETNAAAQKCGIPLE